MLTEMRLPDAPAKVASSRIAMPAAMSCRTSSAWPPSSASVVRIVAASPWTSGVVRRMSPEELADQSTRSAPAAARSENDSKP